MPKKILVIGGAGYVGSALVPKLLDQGHYVRVLDTFWFGQDVFGDFMVSRDYSWDKLDLVYGDIRKEDLNREMENIDCVIHLACISNDPSFELNPALGRSINYDAFLRVIDAAQKAKVKRFIFASSSSVYGVKREENVTEDLALEPLTDYSKYKVFCEMELRMIPVNKLPWVIIRPATVCGYAPRLRLDLIVNILTISALTKGKITVFGGSQKRPNIHIYDMTDLYVQLVEEDDEIIGRVFNAGGNNHTVMEIAQIVKETVEYILSGDIGIEVQPTNDLRSYSISSKKIYEIIGWMARRPIFEAVRSLAIAFLSGEILNPDDPKYSNIKMMQLLKIS